MHSTVSATAILFISCCCFSVPASAQSSRSLPPDGPTLKGDYVLATFDPKTGKLKLEGYSAGGDPVKLSHVKQTLPYTNSASTVTFGDTVYQATYGTIKKGNRDVPLADRGRGSLRGAGMAVAEIGFRD